MMKLLIHSMTACLSLMACATAESIKLGSLTSVPHPRILLLKGEEAEIRKSIANSPFSKGIHELILKESEGLIALPPMQRVMSGRRLLGTSREVLRRVFFLSYAWRMTGERRFFERCEREMLGASGFADWNPSHFLDVGEMTMALAIGYDWLFPALSADSKRTIRDAMIHKGLKTSQNSRYNWWVDATNNWNQVCNSGVAFGAMAVADDEPELATALLERSIRSTPRAMGDYAPDGVYPEGFSYWQYGTSFNVMLICALEKIFATDFGLSKAPGFLKTSGFMQHMTGVTGYPFNWGDCSSKISASSTQFWFAKKNGDLTELWTAKQALRQGDLSCYRENRLLPALMLWSQGIKLESVGEPKAHSWMGQGKNPVCLMRSSWSDPNAVYLGFKVGSPEVNHGHMDIGSFIMESDGVRWASDFGLQDYESLESKGMNIFGRTQDAQRWTVYRMNNHAHNTLTINGALQQVRGDAKIDRYSNNQDFCYAISDISSLYKNQLASAVRGLAMVDRKYVVIRDELVAGDKPAHVRWNMMTFATPVLGDQSIKLTKDGKTLLMKISSTTPVSLKNIPTTQDNGYDAANPGTTMVGFDVRVEPHQKHTIQVLLVPGAIDAQSARFEKPLSGW